MSLPLKSQSALEYMMTYGWAILVIVIVAAVLYSLGVFSPSSAISATVTGFAGFSVQAECISGGALIISVINGVGNEINITQVNYTSNNHPSVYNTSSFLLPSGQSGTLSIPNACPSPAGSRYSEPITLKYTEPGQVLPGPYESNGVVTGTSGSAQTLPSLTGGIAYTGDPGSCGVTYDEYKAFGLQEKLVAPLTCLYNGTCAVSGGDSWTAYGYMYFSGNVTFSTYIDDNAQIFYRLDGSGTWSSVYGTSWTGDNAYCGGGVPALQCNSPFVSSIAPTPGVYEIAFASTYDHCGDGVWFGVRGAAFLNNTLDVNAFENGTAGDYSAVSANPIAPAGVTIDRSVAWPSSYYMYVPAYTASS